MAAAGADVDRRQPHLISLAQQSNTPGYRARRQEAVLDQGACGQDPNHPSRHQSAGARWFHLVADGHLDAGVEQLSRVGLETVMGNTAHRDPAHLPEGARGQGHSQNRSRQGRVVAEDLEEVTHPKEHHAVGMGPLGLPVLAHRRGVGRFSSHLDLGADDAHRHQAATSCQAVAAVTWARTVSPGSTRRPSQATRFCRVRP